ncbi:PREDICTED: tRNA-splicing endonuclease subunit Sen34 [Vollenhovia emeryi]|uniref:tRNA-splicing endonuclease subunit Sen34 n=1 Tax=Vollenhovia emeryi TaxID=411798 RepID=UPI0005F5129D|nr:PREDICTED: tRNA-splicing endonuclease subunit Sen34 [Vollenhovia emeryi]XP_011867039.1 PREDICTED: tRNA-splicing endonuclease subunit Sen34 [Vollenhovia emeryi]XP_011867040.1 PREDICTED: tRNA-splicing endonuclease subunit Sen34 [Vollenhovia emeryi]XP_011867041.1 PREDICTED: tRNA-splicing endonuclease subunit Sen34 [Vollenhovia emeryi]XP_011867042.1 PREDICTED: tRNA-splicing endonuclease subunit Sen34 [Vollenhovia emeryi]
MNVPDVVYLASSRNSAFVWNADDWLRLRRDHRIIGELVGSFPKASRQDIFLGLPLLLLPEEVTLLLEKKIARLVEYTGLKAQPDELLSERFREYKEKLFLEQADCLRDNRKRQISSMMGKIVEGKKRKMLGLHTSKKNMKKPLDKKTQEALDNIEIDTDTLLEEELAKLPKLSKNDALVQIHTAYPWSDKDNVKTVEWKHPLTSEQQLRYKVYKDLWERQYYITSGEKFGGDFLVYPGDPIMFHSQYVVQCRRKDEEIPITEIVAQCRLSCHVRKTLVLATYNEEKDVVKYQSFQWSESSMLKNS